MSDNEHWPQLKWRPIASINITQTLYHSQQSSLLLYSIHLWYCIIIILTINMR